MKLAEYQKNAFQTHVIKASHEARMISLLGLGGEIGSLLAELKKRRRDGPVYTGFSRHLAEELGDILWYVADLASQVQVVLEDPDPMLDPQVGVSTADAAGLDDIALRLQTDAHALGKLVHPGAGPASGDGIARAVQAVVRDLAVAAHIGGLDISAVAESNIAKVRGRWLGDVNTPAFQFDGDSCYEERLPRRIEIEFRERGEPARRQVIIRVHNITIGDRLTDNSYEDDGYRYHDVFHLAYAAVLGWSPVTRSLLRCKRKSKSRIDEVEDGARAQITEEIIALQVYGRAREHSRFAGLNRIDQDLLTMIQRLVQGLEVARCQPWEWEQAILRGFAVFRTLVDRHGGRVRLDADCRLIEYVE